MMPWAAFAAVAVVMAIFLAGVFAGDPDDRKRRAAEAESRRNKLAREQERVSEEMKAKGKHLLRGKAYRPETMIVKFPEQKPANVAQLRKARR